MLANTANASSTVDEQIASGEVISLRVLSIAVLLGDHYAAR
jgi:hypothetical protein